MHAFIGKAGIASDRSSRGGQLERIRDRRIAGEAARPDPRAGRVSGGRPEKIPRDRMFFAFFCSTVVDSANEENTSGLIIDSVVCRRKRTRTWGSDGLHLVRYLAPVYLRL